MENHTITVAARGMTTAATIRVTLEELMHIQEKAQSSIVYRTAYDDPTTKYLVHSKSKAPGSNSGATIAGVRAHDLYGQYFLSSLIPPDDCFVVMTDGTAIYAETAGYSDFAEAVNGLRAGFESADEYQLSLVPATRTAEGVQAFRESGFSTPREYQDAVDRKLDELWALAHANGPQIRPARPEVQNLASFCESYADDLATDSGVQALREALHSGYWWVSDYRDSTDRGFDSYDEYADAMKKGFDSAQDYQLSVRLHLTSSVELSAYHELMKAVKEAGFKSSVGFLLAQVLTRMAPDEELRAKTAAKKIVEEMVRHGLPADANLGHMPTIESEGLAMAELFRSEPNLAQTAIVLNTAGDLRVRRYRPVEGKTVILDVSNIAWHGRSQTDGDKATLRNVGAIVKELENYSFERVIGIADASLPHQLEDGENADDLKSAMEFTTVFKNQSADPHILDAANREQALVVTNDSYRDWTDRDEWRQENLPRILINYRIETGDAKLHQVADELRVNQQHEVRTIAESSSPIEVKVEPEKPKTQTPLQRIIARKMK